MIRLAVRVPREQAELVLAELLDLAPAGVEEADVEGECIEYAVYGVPGELPSLPQLRAVVAGALVEVTTSDVADDWAERWRQFHRPVDVLPPVTRGAGGRSVPMLRIRPPWEAPLPGRRSARVEEIVVDPGQAFGTGAHATTRMCLELLLELAAASEQGPLLDIGTGSGVLAIAAARLGFSPVLALDVDKASVSAARDNAAANLVDIDVRSLDLRREPLPDSEDATQVVLANLLRPLLLELAGALRQPPAHLIAGGLLAAEADEVASAFARRLGLAERVRRSDGEWTALWLAQPLSAISVAARTLAR